MRRGRAATRRTSSSPRTFVPSFGWSTSRERREADLFLDALLGARAAAAVAEAPAEPAETDEDFETEPLIEVCGFFGPNNLRRTEQQVREAVVTRALAEWTAWHNAAGAPRRERDGGMFGRLVGYYLAANGGLLPDTMTALQVATGVAGIDYRALLAAPDTATLNAEAARLRGTLVAAAPGANAPVVAPAVESALKRARQAHDDNGPFKAWSAAYVVACVRGAQITQGLEGVIGPGRRHVGRDELLLASLMHAAYTVEARRRAAATPRRRGTYHAYTPAERAPRLGDLIVQDRTGRITPAQVAALATVPADRLTHGDIVVEVLADAVVTVGGNLGNSARKRRYPLNAQARLVVDARQSYAQEDDAGALPVVPAPRPAPPPGTPAGPVGASSTARIFAVLSPVEECAAVPGQPYRGGILT